MFEWLFRIVARCRVLSCYFRGYHRFDRCELHRDYFWFANPSGSFRYYFCQCGMWHSKPGKAKWLGWGRRNEGC